MSNAEGLSVPASPDSAPLLRADVPRPRPHEQAELCPQLQMELITKEIEAILPPLYSQENVPDPIAVVKFFDPCGRYTFYLLEGQREPGRRSTALWILPLRPRAGHALAELFHC